MDDESKNINHEEVPITMNNYQLNDIDADDESARLLFNIPELPEGEQLSFELISTWGDPSYIGLNGIEIFTDHGTRPDILKITTNTTQIESTSIDNLLNDNYTTKDANQLWTAKYSVEQQLPLTIIIDLSKRQKIAMIRIWNYNQSRVHATRGVRHMRIMLDQSIIFDGEISCAGQQMKNDDGIDDFGDTILFTTDENILESISENDTTLQYRLQIQTSRPVTANNLDSISAARSNAPSIINNRPSTGDLLPTKVNRGGANESDRVSSEFEHFTIDSDYGTVIRGKVLQIELLANWGSPDFIGLTGLQFYASHDGRPISTENCSIQSSFYQHNLQTLLNGRNLTTNLSDMWLAPLFESPSSPYCLTVTFRDTIELSGISIWNYNSSIELSYAGVRLINVYMNGRPVLHEVILRKAPGYVCFDYVQDIDFDRCLLPNSMLRPDTRSISGFIYQLQLLSTWSDEYYIGLNGVELYNNRGQLIVLNAQNLAAFPESVNILPGVCDPRSSDKLIDGVNDTTNPVHMWLAPILPNKINRIFFIFDVPTTVSQIIVYNYRKTPKRGVRDITLSVDDFVVFSGELEMSTDEHTGKLVISLRE